MSNTIQHKRSTTSGTTPSTSDLAVGEIGINTADRTLFTKHSDGTVVPVADVASDTTPQLGGDLDTNGHNIELDYDHRVKWLSSSGNSVQLSMGNNTYGNHITGVSGYALNIGVGEVRINNQIFSSGYKEAASFDPDGECSLRYDNNTKLKTTTTGVEVTGNLVASGNVTANGSTLLANVVEDTSPQLGGNLDMNSNLITSGTGTTQFQYGPGYIDCGTSGGFGLRLGNQGNYSLDITNGEFNPSFSRVAKFTTYGSCDLYYSGSEKFRTTSGGVKVTGDVEVAGSVVHDGDTDTKITFTDNRIGFSAGGTEKLAINNTSSPYNTSVEVTGSLQASLGLNANAIDSSKPFNIYGSTFFASNIIDSPSGYDLLLNCPYDKRFRVHKGGFYTSGVPLIQSSSGTTTDIGLYYGGSLKLTTVSGGVNVTGDLTATGNVTAYSDARLKENVETIDNALNKVCNLRGVSYSKDGKKGIGVIAQEVEEVIPEVVGTLDDKDATRTVAYGNIVGVLIEAIKEQQQQIEDLTAKVTELGGYE